MTKKRTLFVIGIIFVAGIVLVSLFNVYSSIRARKNNILMSNIPKFLQTDFIGLEKIYAISKFRSGSGHDFSKGSGELCRSMKHYFNAKRTEEIEKLISQNNGFSPAPDGQTDRPIYSPVDGEIIDIASEQMGADEQIYIRPDAYQKFTIRLFHIYTSPGIKSGSKVKAGQKIGVIGQYQNTDVVVTIGRNNYVSYFEIMPDELFAKYQALGIKNRSDLIISKATRDANPLQCNGEWFTKNYDQHPSNENFIYLSPITQ